MAITTGKVRASYVNIFQPKAPQGGGEAKYSVTLLIPKTDVTTINRIYAEIEQAKREGVQKVFGGSIPPVCKIPLHDGDGVKQASGEPFGEECKGHMVITASAKMQPSIVGLDMQNIINPADVYSGCYIRANINFFAYNSNGNKGIGCGLNAVQKIEDGEPLTARVSAEEAFGGSNTYAAVSGQYMPAGQLTQMSMQGRYVQPVQMAYQQPTMQPYQQQTLYHTPSGQQMDPITGRPALTGGVMGLQ